MDAVLPPKAEHIIRIPQHGPSMAPYPVRGSLQRTPKISQEGTKGNFAMCLSRSFLPGPPKCPR